MKKLLLIIVSICIALSAACSKSASTTSQNNNDSKVLAKEDFAKMHSDPKSYKGYSVDFYGKVFVQPEKDKEGTMLQVWADANNSLNTIVAIKDTNTDFKQGDIVHIKGSVTDETSGQNAFGATVKAPVVLAKSVEKSDYATAFAPAKKTIDVNQEQNQNGYKLAVKKIEVADNETRVYVSVKNESKVKVHFYSFNTKLIDNGKQNEETKNYDAKYQEVQADILPSLSSDGVIVFPKLSADSGQVQLYVEASSDDYSNRLQPFTFDIKY
ncbi:DUF4352 domain-containing protein [Ectobacillus sp. sgz5001026]|uniref:DUF4352 domain-containing protein n=1 Tax=Ectobacillus sp. sgz5001026 TaxID=3242473 RepID=UPI0036D3EAE8